MIWFLWKQNVLQRVMIECEFVIGTRAELGQRGIDLPNGA